MEMLAKENNEIRTLLLHSIINYLILNVTKTLIFQKIFSDISLSLMNARGNIFQHFSAFYFNSFTDI